MPKSLPPGLAGESNGVVPMEKLEYIINDEPEKSNNTVLQITEK
ncbi:MAG: hypothetical protein R3C41_20770 [Calditrichia bacterium]